MTAGGELVLWGDDIDRPPTGRPRAPLVGAALVTAGLVGAFAGIRAEPFAPLLGLAVFVGTGLLLWHPLRSRRRTISRLWTDPGRPGVVLMRRDDGAVKAIDPARIRKVAVVHTSGSYRDESPGERPSWHGYVLTRLTLRAGATWYTTTWQSFAGGGTEERPSWSQTHQRLEAAFPNARVPERHDRVSSQESAD